MVNSGASNNSLLQGIKLEILKFNGTGVLGWIFIIKQSFELHNVEAEQRISIASIALIDKALNWYK